MKEELAFWLLIHYTLMTQWLFIVAHIYFMLEPCWVAGVPGAPAQACISRRQLAIE